MFNKKFFSVYKHLILLILKNFFHDTRTVFLSFFMPIINFLVFSFVISKSGNNNVSFHDIAGGYLLLTPFTIGTNALALNLIDWKNSIIMKRLHVTPLKKIHFFIAIIFFYFLLIIVSSLWVFLFLSIISFVWTKGDIGIQYKKINLVIFLIGWILFTFTSINLSIFLAGLFNSQNSMQGLIFLIYFPTVFLTGLLFPIELLAGQDSFLHYLGYFIPHKYGAIIAKSGWNYNSSNKVTRESIPFLLLVNLIINFVLISLSVKTFKWETKK